MKCTEINCQGFNSCKAEKFYLYDDCMKKKVKGKIDAAVPDGVCKKCEYVQSLCYCTLMREEQLHKTSEVVPECRKDYEAVQFGKVWILKSKLQDFN